MLKAGVDLNLGIETETLEFKKSTGELNQQQAQHPLADAALVAVVELKDLLSFRPRLGRELFYFLFAKSL